LGWGLSGGLERYYGLRSLGKGGLRILGFLGFGSGSGILGFPGF